MEPMQRVPCRHWGASASTGPTSRISVLGGPRSAIRNPWSGARRSRATTTLLRMAEALIKANALRKTFDDFVAVDDIDFVLERHLAYEVDNRLRLDIGQAVVRNATTPAAGMERLNEIRDYIVETVAFSFRNRRAQGTTLSATDAAAVSASALRDAYAVFEEYTG